MALFASLFYAGIALLALAVNGARGAPLLPVAPLYGLHASLEGYAVAVALAAAVVGLSVAAERLFAFARAMAETFRGALGALTLREVLLLAALSGVAEELLFRGALLPWLTSACGSQAWGNAVQAALFGAVHFGGRQLLPWTLFALAMGLVFGALFLATGDLGPPIVLHALVNAVNLRRITRSSETPAPPGRIGS